MARKKKPELIRKTPCDLCRAGHPCTLAMTPADCAGVGGGPYTSVAIKHRMQDGGAVRQAIVKAAQVCRECKEVT